MADLDGKSIDSITKLAREAGTVQTAPNGIPFVIIPAGSQLVSLEKLIYHDHRERPDTKSGTVEVYDAESFCQYWDDFSDENSQVFADEAEHLILAILDYHGRHADGGARWCRHRLKWELEASPEWNTWTGKNGAKMNQSDFADFIESNTPDIVTPNGATMLEVARDLRAKVDVEFASAQRQSNGAINLHYNEQVKGTFGSGDLAVPEEFAIGIPVFIGGDRVRLVARLRYRLNGGKLIFWFDLLRHEEAERAAFQTVRGQIAEKKGIRILSGKPEVRPT